MEFEARMLLAARLSAPNAPRVVIWPESTIERPRRSSASAVAWAASPAPSVKPVASGRRTDSTTAGLVTESSTRGIGLVRQQTGLGAQQIIEGRAACRLDDA